MLATVLFIGSLFPRMSAEQMTRLPELLTHYRQHQREEGQNLSFWAFLLEHYVLDSQHHKAPNHSHSRLPTFDGGSPAYDSTPVFQLICEPGVTVIASLAVFKTRFMNARLPFSFLLQPPRH